MIRQTTTIPVNRMPELASRPDFTDSPWHLAADRSHFWRICNGGDIYTLDIATQDLRRF